MYSLLAKKGQMFAILLGVIVVVVYLATVISGLGSSGYSLSDDLNQIMKNNPDQQFSFFNIGLGLTVLMIILCFVFALLFGIWQLISNPKGSIKAIISLVAIAAVFFAMYTISDSDAASAISVTLQKFNVTENISKLISGGLWSTIILAALALGAMVVFEVYNLFK